MTFQFSIWDKFRDLENLPATNVSNLVHLVGHLLRTKSLPLSILKVRTVDELGVSWKVVRVGVRSSVPWFPYCWVAPRRVCKGTLVRTLCR